MTYDEIKNIYEGVIAPYIFAALKAGNEYLLRTGIASKNRDSLDRLEFAQFTEEGIEFLVWYTDGYDGGNSEFLIVPLDVCAGHRLVQDWINDYKAKEARVELLEHELAKLRKELGKEE